MKAYLYCDKRSLNEATLFYNSIIVGCLRDLGYEIITAFSLNEIRQPDLIFTITSVNFVKAKIRFPYVKTISWRQGLGYAEARMTRPFIKWFPFFVCELLTLHCANYLFFVSEQMKDYYKKYFLYFKDNYTIMPCYNLPLAKFNGTERYNHPSFVYAGGVDKWQGIAELLDIYAIIEKEICSSSLTLYVRDKEYILEEAAKRNIKNITVKYVPLEQLQNELSQYKYGFILRQKNSVNYVATPTKMNSYLAAYLIPIFSNGVNDFERNIKLGEFTIMVDTPLNPDKIAEQIIDFERTDRDYRKFPEYVNNIFMTHYYTPKYSQEILRKLKEVLS